MADLFIVGLIAHLFADWFAQNDWQATNKANLRHPAAWVHFGWHAACLALAWCLYAWAWWPALAALVVAVTHSLIDTRKPLVWWRTTFRQKQIDPSKDPGSYWNQAAMAVAFWQDQSSHLIILGIASAVIA